MKKPILVVMAAGMGSRYGGLKQIDPVGGHGEAILDYSLFDARRAGFETVVIIIKHEIEADFMQTVGRRIQRSGLEIRYAYQQLQNLPVGYQVPADRQKPWGTSHAVLSAKEAIGDAPFAVLNADDYYGVSAFQAIYDYLSQTADDTKYNYAMVGYLLKNTVTDNGSVARGICVPDDAGFLASVTEQTCIEKYPGGIHYTEDGENWIDVSGDTIVSMNLWGFTPSFLRELESRFPAFLDKTLVSNPLKGEFYLPSAVSDLLAEGKARVKILTSHDKWFGVTYQEDKPQVVDAIAKMTAEGLYPENLWKKI